MNNSTDTAADANTSPQPGAGESPPAAPPPLPPPVKSSVADPAPGASQPLDGGAVPVATELAALREMFEKRLSYDKTKEEAFDRLYTELEELKKNAAAEQLRPLFIDLILLFDRIENATQMLTAAKPDVSETVELVRTLGEELIEILARREVEQILSSAEVFDAAIHRAIGVEAVENEAQGNRVVRVVRRGFRLGKRILRPEEVIVTKHATKKPLGTRIYE